MGQVETIKVYRPGAIVWIGCKGDNVQASVTSVNMQNAGRVQYEVAWWSGRDRKTAWVEEWEVTAVDLDRSLTCKIGFAQSPEE